jgi:hypothetical protein
MDKSIIKSNCEIDQNRENDASVKSQTLINATLSVPTCDCTAISVEPSTSKSKIRKNMKADKGKYRHTMNLTLNMDSFQIWVIRLFHSASFETKLYRTAL